MEYERRFKFLVCARAFDDDDLEGQRLAQIVDEVARSGYTVIKARKPEDAELVIRTDAAVGCVVLDWGKLGPQGKMAALVQFIRKRGLETPIYVLVRRHRLEDIPVDVMYEADGYVFLADETPEFIAKNLVSRLRQYAETLKTPFFGALVDYNEEANQLWTCPGHNGGVFYSRSPIGRIFVDHLGEAVFRDDLDNSVVELGDLLTHEGPALAAQREAAKIFGAERTYFVLNGTSTSNKIVLQGLVAPGDLVLFDRNNHKAAHHGALLLGGGIPIYLPTDRNAHGLIGPLDAASLDETALRERIRTHPLVDDPQAWRRERPFPVAVIEQCTYDGTIYSAEEIVRRVGHLCDYIMFDEAWTGFMKFHPIYRGRFAMGLDGLDASAPGIMATQSTHKQLASFSQASQIHGRDSHIAGQARRLEHRRFNEFFMMAEGARTCATTRQLPARRLSARRSQTKHEQFSAWILSSRLLDHFRSSRKRHKGDRKWTRTSPQRPRSFAGQESVRRSTCWVSPTSTKRRAPKPRGPSRCGKPSFHQAQARRRIPIQERTKPSMPERRAPHRARRRAGAPSRRTWRLLLWRAQPAPCLSQSR